MDAFSGSLNGLFDWSHPNFNAFILHPISGEPVKH